MFSKGGVGRGEGGGGGGGRQKLNWLKNLENERLLLLFNWKKSLTLRFSRQRVGSRVVFLVRYLQIPPED